MTCPSKEGQAELWGPGELCGWECLVQKLLWMREFIGFPGNPELNSLTSIWFFLWAPRFYSLYLKPWWWASAHGGREKLLSLPHTKATPFRLSLGNLFQLWKTGQVTEKERHTGTVERTKSLLEVFFFSQVAPLCGLESRAALPPKRQWWAFIFFFSLSTVVVSQMWERDGGYI